MVTKSKSSKTVSKKSRVKVDKLSSDQGAIKELNPEEKKRIKGGGLGLVVKKPATPANSGGSVTVGRINDDTTGEIVAAEQSQGDNSGDDIHGACPKF
jgi:hypothetical protein